MACWARTSGHDPGPHRAVVVELRGRLPGLVRQAAEQTAGDADILRGRRFEAAGQWQMTRQILPPSALTSSAGDSMPRRIPSRCSPGATTCG